MEVINIEQYGPNCIWYELSAEDFFTAPPYEMMVAEESEEVNKEILSEYDNYDSVYWK